MKQIPVQELFPKHCKWHHFQFAFQKKFFRQRRSNQPNHQSEYWYWTSQNSAMFLNVLSYTAYTVLCYTPIHQLALRPARKGMLDCYNLVPLLCTVWSYCIEKTDKTTKLWNYPESLSPLSPIAKTQSGQHLSRIHIKSLGWSFESLSPVQSSTVKSTNESFTKMGQEILVVSEHWLIISPSFT